MKLWPDSAAAVQIPDVAGLPRVYGQVEKRVLHLAPEEAREEPLRLIYLLTPGLEISRTLTSPEAFAALKEHCRDDAILPRELRARQFEELARLVRVVPVRRVPAHTGLDRLPAFARKLVEDSFAHVHRS